MQFINAAEECALITPLTEFILTQACLQMRELATEGSPVTLTGTELHDSWLNKTESGLLESFPIQK